jgi:imidazolonepropionase-like amidohydrolase
MQERWRIKSTWMLGLGLFGCLALPSSAQVSTARVEGLRDNTPRYHVLTGVRLVSAPGKVIENSTVVVKDGLIVAAGAGVAVPAGARVWRLDGRTVYAGFIDMNSNVGVPSNMTPNTGARGAPARTFSGRALASDNIRVRPEQDIASQVELRSEEVKNTRELGFTNVLATPASGIFRGQSALLSLNASDNPKSSVIRAKVAQHLANELDPMSRSTYPSSLMGVVAQVRQTYYDARWYKKQLDAVQESKGKFERPQLNDSLDALQASMSNRQPTIYFADNEQAYPRIAKIRDEFNLNVIMQGNGFEYRALPYLKKAGMPVITPLNFPANPDLENPDYTLDTNLETLSHWEQAPSNLAYLQKEGIEFSVTAAGLKDPKREFWARLRLAVKRGLTADYALAAMTTVPAKLLGESKRLGIVEAGRMANLVVASGDLFTDEKANIEITFVDGKPFVTEHFDKFDVRGTWDVKTATASASWDIKGTPAKAQLVVDGVNADIVMRDKQIVVRLGDKTIMAEGRGDELKGTILDAQGNSRVWSAKRSKAFVAEKSKTESKPEALPPVLTNRYPYGAFGVTPAQRQDTILVKNATIWTSSKVGTLEQSDMLVVKGKITAIGKNLSAPKDALIIDATGKHVSPGIIDAHSHTAMLQGTNEATSSNTAEVRVGDALDATSMGIYRQLAGGVTAANVMHGSANTIGGQNQIIKMRWGRDADSLKFEDAFPGIKFALGENVKGANFGDGTRYPQTRMGVEQILRSHFLAAKSYKADWDDWKKSPKSRPEPRRDLQMDTLVELLERKRMIHIHSYRQDEILMFVRFAEEFGLRVGTFQHVMEGYKVADAIAKLGAGGSTFSDWWGYKMEVVDSVPHNGAIMHAAGVLTTFNSDSDELARRLNTEAAKAVKYGGLNETEAFKFVTINAAKQMAIDDRVGSLEVGKDGDFVIWSGNPLSTMSRAEQTWIEGARYFDLASDARMRQELEQERHRLISKAMPAKSSTGTGANPAANSAAKMTETALTLPKTQLEINREFLELQHWMRHAMKHRTSYWNQKEAHECTEEE